jgi:chemotaxis-related protein WspB
MKVLVFSIGPDRYCLRLAAISRVLPVVDLKHIPLAPDFVAGLLDLHGAPVPVIDLSRLAGQAAEQVWFDTRIILVDYPAGDGGPRQLGLQAEHVIGIETLDEELFADGGATGAPFLGQVASHPAGMLQLVEVDQLLSPAVRALLFQPAVAPP